jgi:hypothetical protein
VRLINEINPLGSNLLTVTNGQSLTGGPAELAPAAPGMVWPATGRQGGPVHRRCHTGTP